MYPFKILAIALLLAACQHENPDMPTLGEQVDSPIAYRVMCAKQPESALCKK